MAIIEVAVDKVKVTTEKLEVNLPTKPTYYKWLDDESFFPRGLVLFAIIPKSPNSTNYFLFQVEQSKQEFDDFHPMKDCSSVYWLESSNIRHDALYILKGKSDFKEINEEEFLAKREVLLNSRLAEVLSYLKA